MSESAVVEKIIETIPLKELINFLIAIQDQDFPRFETQEDNFVSQYGLDTWEEFFNFRLLPSLDCASSSWLLNEMLLVKQSKHETVDIS